MSKISYITLDNWEGVYCKETKIDAPTLDCLFAALDKLDANISTLLHLYCSDENYMAIGGGGVKFVLYVSIGGERFWNLLQFDTPSKQKLFINVGGQEGDFLENQILDRTLVNKAAVTYFESGLMDSRLIWQLQP